MRASKKQASERGGPRTTVASVKSLFAQLCDTVDALPKPWSGSLALVSPSAEDSNLLHLGGRVVEDDGWCHGLDAGEGYPVLDFDADVWWVVQPVKVGPVDIGGLIRLYRFNVIFAGPPADAVDYLARSLMHTSAAVCGVTVHSSRRNDAVSVGCVGVAISLAGTATAGHGGVAFGARSAVAGDGGLAFCGRGGRASVGDEGLSRVVGDGVAEAGCGGTAIAGDGGTAVGDNVFVGDGGLARLGAPEGYGRGRACDWTFAAGEGSAVRVQGVTLHAGADFQPRVAYRVKNIGASPVQFERDPVLDPIVARAVLGASCDVTQTALIRYFLEHRPLRSEGVRERGLRWLAAHQVSGGPNLPEAAEWYVLEGRDGGGALGTRGLARG